MDFDFQKVVEYIETYSYKQYGMPEKAPADQKEYMSTFHDKGSEARKIFLAYAKEVANNFPDMEVKCSRWVDAKQKCPGWLWVRIYKKGFKDLHSISLNINHTLESNNEIKNVISFRVEAKDNDCDEADYARHNTLVEVPLPTDSNIFYQADYQDGKTLDYRKDQAKAKQDIKNGTIKKLKVVKILSKPYNVERSSDLVSEGIKAMRELMPFYDHIINSVHKEGSSKAWLLTYNASNSSRWPKYEEYCQSTKSGKKCVESWRCVDTHPAIGDEVYLMKLGDSPTGVFAHGIVSRGSHTDPQEAAEGKKTKYIDVTFDRILNYQFEKIIFKDTLMDEAPGYTWNPQNSGHIISEPALTILRQKWNELVGQKAGGESTAMKESKNFDLNTILYGPPGTGKTYNTAIYAVAICDDKTLEDVKKMPYEEVLKRYRELKKEKQVEFITFHQSYVYEEFIEGIKPEIKKDNSISENVEGSSDVGYIYKDGIFKRFCKNAEDEKNANKRFVFIIDEINRGNISKIFGELITLIEDTKRSGMAEAALATLPYTGEEFSVPKNVYIIGTMNTADRSIALIDTALRRRFRFVEMMPDVKVLEHLKANMVKDLDVGKMLSTINDRITLLYDREHTIGHAFFTKLAKDPSVDTLRSIFEKDVIPLLQEYFYEDYHKIQLVLGDNEKTDNDLKFIKDEEVKFKEIFKGNADDIVDLPEKKYTINNDALSNLEAYKAIY